MPSYSALSPVSAAVYAALNVSAMTSLVTGIYDDVPQGVTFPFVLIEVRGDDISGMGDSRDFEEIELRVHAFSAYEGMKQAQQVIAKAKELLRNRALTISGYAQAGKVFYDKTVPLTDEMVNGVKCKEIVAFFRIYAESNP